MGKSNNIYPSIPRHLSSLTSFKDKMTDLNLFFGNYGALVKKYRQIVFFHHENLKIYQKSLKQES